MWKELNKKKLQVTRIGDLCEICSESPEGEKGQFILLEAQDWAIVIPETNDGKNFLMVDQYRHGAKEISTEFPGGVINKGETPERGATRELLEETGFKVQNLIKLGSMSPNPAIMTNQVHFFLARNLINTGKQNLDNDEYLTYKEVPITEVLNNMGKPPYIHALMCAALNFYRQHTK